MLEESSVLIGLEVFTPWGVRIGAISDLELDSEEEEITNIYLEETNDRLVEDGANLMIPFRWVQGLGDIVILKHFPEDLPISSPGEGGIDEFRL